MQRSSQVKHILLQLISYLNPVISFEISEIVFSEISHCDGDTIQIRITAKMVALSQLIENNNITFWIL